jgi:6-pyruvoyltetrahydropterin/6-carboxytetrahydropterin synthase
MEVVMTTIRKDMGTFSAAHQLPHHDGKCANLHGHEYRVIVEVGGPVKGSEAGPEEGMVFDFGRIKEVYKQRIESLCDHALLLGEEPLPWYGAIMAAAEMSADALLGKVAHLPIKYTTAEFLARWMTEEMYIGMFGVHPDARHVSHSYYIAVEVYETPTSMARFEI